jgi:plasmid stabilization system protein ParE
VNRRLVVRPSAERDLTAAATYYFEEEGGGERGLALASRFLAAIRASLTAIAETPLAWPLVTRTKRKYLVSVHDRFPFVIYYVVSAEEIAVVAILHGSRNPTTWKRRQ